MTIATPKPESQRRCDSLALASTSQAARARAWQHVLISHFQHTQEFLPLAPLACPKQR